MVRSQFIGYDAQNSRVWGYVFCRDSDMFAMVRINNGSLMHHLHMVVFDGIYPDQIKFNSKYYTWNDLLELKINRVIAEGYTDVTACPGVISPDFLEMVQTQTTLLLLECP